ncbi:MAG: hypothetical protein FWF81_05700 [Defluviitaleaceae bacterium]|nr:hypothetical protein [Defluviitaleaceae bacterium]
MMILNVLPWVLLLGAIAVIIIKGNQHSKMREQMRARFLEEENEANMVRKKEIEPELYFTADLSALPPIPESDPYQVERCAKRIMIRFAEPITNLELKKQYGLQQMDIIAQYEENFNEYLKALTKWAVSISNENRNDAIKILETVIYLGSELRDSYKLSADIYAENRNTEKLSELLARAEENHFKDPSIREQVLDYINMKKVDASL